MNLMRDLTRGVVFDGTPASSTVMERLRGRWHGTGSWTHWAVLDRVGRSPDGPSPRFILRVDDFPRWDRGPEGFLTFHSIVRDAGIRYLLGVIPRPAEDPQDPAGRGGRWWTHDEAATLSEVAVDVEIALHGFSHRRRPGPVPAEIVGCPAQELEHILADGLAVLHGAGFSARAYIPPFNAVDRTALAVISRRFDMALGGPESVRWLGRVPGPCKLEGIWFLPSYPPAYGRARDAVSFVSAVRGRPLPLLIPITLHWAWEEADRFDGVRRLVGVLAGATVSPSEWLEGRAWAT